MELPRRAAVRIARQVIVEALRDGPRRGRELQELARAHDARVSRESAWQAMVDLQDEGLIQDEPLWGPAPVDHRNLVRWRLTGAGLAGLAAQSPA